MTKRPPKASRSPQSIGRARRLRHDQTEAEQQLWCAIRNRQLKGVKFRRQVPIGPYIADFASPTKRLVIELDGGQHTDRHRYDEARTRVFSAQGYRVLRFWNNEVTENMQGVLETIQAALQE